MIKFSLTANHMQQDGFKLSTQAESQEEILILKELTLKLIDKISVIEIKQVNEDYG